MIKELKQTLLNNKNFKAKVKNGAQKGKIVVINSKDVVYNMQMSSGQINLDFCQELKTENGQTIFGYTFRNLTVITEV